MSAGGGTASFVRALVRAKIVATYILVQCLSLGSYKGHYLTLETTSVELLRVEELLRSVNVLHQQVSIQISVALMR